MPVQMDRDIPFNFVLFKGGDVALNVFAPVVLALVWLVVGTFDMMQPVISHVAYGCAIFVIILQYIKDAIVAAVERKEKQRPN